MEAAERAIRVAEDDSLRSNHVCKLVRDITPLSEVNNPTASAIPRSIIQYWHDRDSIPDDVQSCLDSWADLESHGFRRRVFDDASARRFIDEKFGERHVRAFDRCHHPAMRCDFFRLCYILNSGGFYVDADERFQGKSCEQLFGDNRLKLQPLCYDKKSDSMVSLSEFVRSDRHSDDWIYYVNNNPIIAPAGHPVIVFALERATKLLLSCDGTPDIQSTTGPGNLTASLVWHSVLVSFRRRDDDFALLPDWEIFSVSPWSLDYRNDERNWRLWNPIDPESRL